MAETAPTQTTSGMRYFAAIVAVVICPTSPHSEKKIAAKETIAARDAGYSLFESRLSGFRHNTSAMAKKLMAVMAPTTSGGSLAMALPKITAAPLFALKAA